MVIPYMPMLVPPVKWTGYGCLVLVLLIFPYCICFCYRIGCTWIRIVIAYVVLLHRSSYDIVVSATWFIKENA